MKEGFSFFNTDAELADKVMTVLNGAQHNGRKINVEISKMMVQKTKIEEIMEEEIENNEGGFSGRRRRS